MYGRHTIWFPLAVLLLLALLSLWVDHAVQPPQPKPDGSSRHDPDYKLENFNSVKMDQDGNPRHLLAAVEMRHYPDDDSTELVRPRFTQYATGQPYTQIEGQRGLVSSNGENVYFMDNVKAVRGATKDKGELVLLTDYLHIIPDQDLAVTDHPVTITQEPGTIIKANGMELNKRERTLKLLNGVRVHYLKPKPPPPKTAAARPAAGRSGIAGKKPAASRTMNQPSQRQPNAGDKTARVRRHYEKP